MSSVILNEVIKIIQEFGNDDHSLITYTETVSASDPTDASLSSSSDPILSYEGRYKKGEIDNTTIKIGDIKLYVDPSTCSTEPTTNDKISDGTNTYTIINIDRYKQQDTVVLYILQLRK